MASYIQGIFKPKNPQKVVGNKVIQYRSSWEQTMMRLCDEHPDIIKWASESIQIPYHDPLTNKWRRYIPDFFIVYVDKLGKQHGEIIEVKPMSQTLMTAAKSKKDKAAIVTNTAKWLAAKIWCKNNGLTFSILTEQQLFANMGRAKIK